AFPADFGDRKSLAADRALNAGCEKAGTASPRLSGLTLRRDRVSLAGHLFKRPAMEAIIYHNPRCGTSRNTLALIRNAGMEPRIVAYPAAPPTREELRALIAAPGLAVRAAIREKEASYAALGLADPALSDDELLDHMVAEPILINRPFVTTPLGTRL